MSDNQNNIIQLLGQLMTKVDQRYDQVITHVNTKHDDVMTKVDSVYKEVLNVRQEQTTHQLQHADIDEDLAAIKAVPAVAHELKRK